MNVDIIDTWGDPVYVTPASLNSVFPKAVDANLVVSASIYIIAGGGFGVTWRLTYAQVFPQMRQTARNVFMDEEVTETTQEATESEIPVQNSLVEDESQLEEAPAPAPAAAPAKTGRRRAVGAAV